MLKPVNIAGIGTFVPRLTRRNADYDTAAFGVDEEWIAKSGLRERRWAAAHESILDLAYEACQRAMRHADIGPDKIDMLLLVTSTFEPGLVVPSGVARLQQRLGIDRCMSTCLAETCAGLLMAMEMGADAVASGRARNVLVVAAETFSKTFNPTDPVTFRIGFSMGDAAAAVVLSGRDDWENGRLGAHFVTNSDFVSGLGMRPAQRNGQDGRGSDPAAGLFFGFAGVPPSYKGRLLSPAAAMEEIKRFTTRTVPAAIRHVLDSLGWSIQDIDFYALHQPNRRFLDAWLQAAEIPGDRTLDTFGRYGNMSSASAIVNLDMANQLGRLKPGDRILLAAVGEGASWGASVWTWRHVRQPAISYLLQEETPSLEEELVNTRRYTMLDLWEKHIAPGVRDTYRHDELFSELVPAMAVFEGVPVQDAFAFLARPENMVLWTLSMRSIRHIRDDIYLAEEEAAPTGQVYVQTVADPAAQTIAWNCGHTDPDDLWIAYRGMLLDAQRVLGRPGTVFLWTSFTHERVKHDPVLAAGFRMMFSAHGLEIRNLKRILEHQHAVPAEGVR